MKVRIQINNAFGQKLLQDDDFRSKLSLVIDDEYRITEIWVKNKVIDNDEVTFRAQVLEMIKEYYLKINDVESDNLEVSFEGNNPIALQFTGPKYRLGTLVSIIDESNE